METWGYEDEDQAAANLWGHGLGLAQYDPPVISRIWSLDHPVEILEGMTFALETQHGKKFRYGVRIEEMLIVDRKSTRLNSSHLGISYAVFCFKKKTDLTQRR